MVLNSKDQNVKITIAVLRKPWAKFQETEKSLLKIFLNFAALGLF